MRILLIEDDKATARNVRTILDDVGSYIGVAELGEAGIARAQNELFDLVVLDLMLPDMHGLEVLRRLRAVDVVARILILTADISMDMLVNCLENGADDYLTKPFHAGELIARVHALERRGVETAKLMTEARDAYTRMAPLTQREREVVDRLVAGRSNKAAAQELGISTRTVEVHRAHIMEKLHARSLSDVVRVALAAARLPGDGADTASINHANGRIDANQSE